MHAAGLALEVEDVDKRVRVLNIKLFLRYAFSDDIGIVVDADHRIRPLQLPEKLVTAGLVNSDLAALLFAGYLGFLDQSLDEVVNDAALGDQ